MALICSTRSLKNAKFLQSLEVRYLPELEPIDGFSSLVPLEILRRLHLTPPEEIEIEKLAQAVSRKRPPRPKVKPTVPLFSGTLRFVRITFSSGGRNFTVPDSDLNVAIQYSGLAIGPISQYCSQYGPNKLQLASASVPFNAPVTNGKYNDSILSGWVDKLAKANGFGEDSCLTFLNPQGVVNTDADPAQGVGGYHNISSSGVPYCFVNVMGQGLTVDDRQDFYAVALSHEIAEATVDPKADGSNQEVCDPCAGNCLPADAIILGDNKPISDYRAGDVVAGASGEQLVKQTFNRDFEGDLIVVKALGMLPFRLTPEHEVLLANGTDDTKHISYSVPTWKPIVKAIPKLPHRDGDYIVMPRMRGTIGARKVDLRPYIHAHLSSLRYPNKVRGTFPLVFPINESTAWLLGVYVAEGCPHLGKRESSVHFVLSETEIQTSGRLRDVCGSLGLNLYSRPVDGEKAIHLRFRSVILARFFKEILGDSCYNKRIPDFILYNKNIRILRAFLDGYMLGDGSESQTRGYNYYRFSTSSKVLALQLQLAFGRLRVFVAVRHERKGGKGLIMGRNVRLHDQYVGGWGDHSGERLHGGSFYLPIKHLGRVKYEGAVCNLSTADHTYLASNSIVHNCNVDFRNYFDSKGTWLGGSAAPGYSFFIDGIATPGSVARCPAPQSSCSYPPPATGGSC